MAADWCGVKLSRSSSGNAGGGRDYRGHIEILQARLHSCAQAHAETHRGGTRAEELSHSPRRTQGHMFAACASKSASIVELTGNQWAAQKTRIDKEENAHKI